MVPDQRVPTAGTSYGVHVTVAPYNDRFAIRIGNNLTPQVVSATLRDADIGYMWRLADLANEVRQMDPHLQSVLSKRESQVARAKWELRPADDSGDDGKKIADWATKALKRIRGLTRTFVHLQGGPYHGRAGSEVIWSKTDLGFVPIAFSNIMPRRWTYATDWRLHLWDATAPSPTPQFGVFPGVPMDSFPRGKFIVHAPVVTGDYPTREGLARMLAFWCAFKRWDWRDWMAYAELVGRPPRIGKYSSGTRGDKGLGSAKAAPSDVALLEQALDTISGSVGVSLPDTLDLSLLLHSGANNEVHERLAAAINAEISKAVLGETLTTEPGTRGARSLGEVHDEIRLMIANGDSQDLAETWYFDVLCPMVEMNFGKDAPVPEMDFDVQPKQSKDSVAKQIKDGTSAGVKLGQRDAREMLGWPEPEDDDEVVPGIVAAPTPPASNGDGNGKEVRPGPGKTSRDRETDGAASGPDSQGDDGAEG